MKFHINHSHSKVIFLIIILISAITFYSCKNSENYFFYLSKSEVSKSNLEIIIEDLNSDNKQKKRKAIVQVKELQLKESKKYLENIILNKIDSLNDRLLAVSTYTSIFKEESINLAQLLTANYDYNDVSIAVELIYHLLEDVNFNFDINLLREQFGTTFFNHFKRANSFLIKSKTMMVLSYFSVKELISLIKDTLKLENPILGETLISLARLYKDKDKSKYEVERKQLRNFIINTIKKTKDNNLRRLLRRALYIIDNEKEIIPVEILNTISDLGSISLPISLIAEEKIKQNFLTYKKILFDYLFDTEDLIKYKVSSIISNFELSGECKLIDELLNDIANGKIINTTNPLYIPILRNFINLCAKSKCSNSLALLKKFLSNKDLSDITMLALINFDDDVLSENNIEIIPKSKNKFNSEIISYIFSKKDYEKLVNLLKSDNVEIVLGTIFYLKKSYFDNKYQKIIEIYSSIKDETIKALIKTHLID